MCREIVYEVEVQREQPDGSWRRGSVYVFDTYDKAKDAILNSMMRDETMLHRYIFRRRHYRENEWVIR